MERCSAPREVVRNAERLLRDDRTLLEGVGRLLRGRASTEEPREQINVQLVAAFGRYVGDAARPTLARACGYYIPKPTTHPPFLRRWLSPPRVGRAGSTKTTTSLWESRERRKPPKSRSDVSPHRRYNAPLRHNGVTCCALASTPLMSAYGILRPADGVRTCALSRARSLARALSVSALADRKLCLQYHPDKSPCTTELFQIIAQAKEVLTDQIARTHYDWSCDWFDPARSSCTGGRSAAAAAAAAETGAAEARAAEAGAAATAWYRRPCCHRTRRPAPQASARTARSSARASARASARPSPSAPGSARPSNSDNDDMPDLISGSDDDSDDESGDDSDGDSDDAVNPEQQGRDGRLPGWIPTWRRQKCDAVNHTFPGAWWRHCGATKHVRRRAAARRWSGASRAAAAEAHAQRKEGSLGDPCAAAGGDDAAAGGSPESAEEAAGNSAGDDADPSADIHADPCADVDTASSADMRACCPRTNVDTDPNADTFAYPRAVVDADSCAGVGTDPSADIRAYSCAVVDADPSADVDAAVRAVVDADPCANVDTDPITEVDDPSAGVDTDSSAKFDTDLSADIRAYPRAVVGADPSTEVDDPSAGVDTDSSAKFDIDPSADIRACPRAVVGADPSAEFEIDPSADIRAYSRAVVGADPCADVDTDPSADVDAGSCADVDTDPSADIRAYFRADVDTIPSTEVDDPSAGVDTDSSADVEIDPSADVRAYPRTVVGADPCADVDTDPGADIDADSCADVDIDPSSDIRAYPRAGIDTNSSTDGGLANSSANDEHKAIARSELAAARNVLAARSLTVVVLVAIVAQPEVVAKLLCIIGVVLAALACDNGGAALPSPTHDCLRGGGPVSGDNGDEETDEIHKPSIWCNHDCLRGGGTPTAADSAYDAVEDLPGDELEQYRWLAGQSFRIVRGGVPSGTRYVVTHLERCAYKDGTYENVAYFLDPQVELLPCNASDASVSATEAASGTKKGVPGDSHCTVAEAIEFVRLTKLQEGAAYNEANFTRYSRSGHTRPIDRRYWEVPLVDCKGGSCAFGWPVR